MSDNFETASGQPAYKDEVNEPRVIPHVRVPCPDLTRYDGLLAGGMR